MTDWLIGKPTSSPPAARFLLAHGAGAPMDSEFMEQLSGLLCHEGCEVIRFEFPYMAKRRMTGKRSPPDRAPALTQCWREQIAELNANSNPGQKLIIGGKSMGGRMASLVADELAVTGLVCFGYPFHPPRKPEQLRVEHLHKNKIPTLIVQGSRDPLGHQQEVESYHLPRNITMCWLSDGDHDFKPRVKSGFTWQQHLESAAINTRSFIDQL
jgi:predicted alpha/beta-hydrolase family hydrolase